MWKMYYMIVISKDYKFIIRNNKKLNKRWKKMTNIILFSIFYDFLLNLQLTPQDLLYKNENVRII